jgi:hypothetical protein
MAMRIDAQNPRRTGKRAAQAELFT